MILRERRCRCGGIDYIIFEFDRKGEKAVRILNNTYNDHSRITKTIRARSLVMSVIKFRRGFNKGCMSKYRNNMYLPYFLFDERGRRIEIG